MGLTDDISVLWREEVYEADLGAGSLSVQEAGNPFVLMESVFADTTGESLSSDAYRQVSYVNDINRVNVQAVMEYTVNGGMGESVTSYSFGMQRESYTMTLPGLSVGAGETALRVEGTYYYTGTESVSNLTDGKGNGKSYAYALSGEAYSFAMYQGEDAVISVTAGTYSAYGYNGEYTHQSIGLQYLRARYLSLETGTFTSRDSYGGRVWDILSQNRYTYAENNPVTYGDPSGHATALKGIGNTVGSKVTGGLSSLKTSLAPAVTKKSTGVPLSVGATNGAGITTTAKNLPLSVGATNGAGIVSTPNKLPSLLDNIRIYNGMDYYNNLVARVPVRALMSTAGGMTYAESVAAQIEAKRCVSYDYCENPIQEIIKGNVDLDVMPIYGKAADDNDRLPVEEQIANAEYIYWYLIEKGWTTEAICGLLGNVHIESHYNPGTWQVMNNQNNGYGLAQWTDAESKILQYINNQFEGNYTTKELINVVNDMATDSPQELMNFELTYFLYSCKNDYWSPTLRYDSPAKVSFEDYIVNKDNYDAREMALIFHGAYEKSEDDITALEKRENWAEGWYKHFMGIEDIRECYEKYDY